MLRENGEWVGPPVLELELRLGEKKLVLDGRKRLKEYAVRGLRTAVPRITVRSHLEAIKTLIHHKHSVRAAEHAVRYAPQFVQFSSSSLGVLMDMHHTKLQPYIKALKNPGERHKLPRRAMKVVIRARSLYQRAIEGEPIEISDIEKVLGEFLDE